MTWFRKMKGAIFLKVAASEHAEETAGRLNEKLK
jgi:hypothetical protein